jgi:1-acyl-sn-glycerol-3-phosphate acyltransferase
MLFHCFQLDIQWMGKDSLFRGPFGFFFRAVGGLPIDRSASHNVVDQVVHEFNTRERMKLVIAPEGTRKQTDHWKSGFYHIARGAQVPVVLGFIDYKHKLCGVGPTLQLSGDVEADMRIIRAFYAPITGKHPEQTGEIRLRGEEEGGE